MRNLPYQPLLLSLLTVVGAGCAPEREEDVSYIPGERPLRGPQLDMPGLPCLPKSDPRLEGFEPACSNDFEITSGPTQSTNAEGKTICVYHIEYDVTDTCDVGRPLRRQGVAVIAPLHTTKAWTTT